MTTTQSGGATALWIVLLTVASLFTTWALACMTPFAALAAVAATQMRGRDGAALMLASWGVSQAVGFGLLHYPHDPLTLAWGAALGLAALGAVGGGYLALSTTRSDNIAVRLAVAFVGAFVAFKAVLLVADVVLGSPFASTIAPKLLLVQIPHEALVAVVLVALYRGLVALGVPAIATPTRTALA